MASVTPEEMEAIQPEIEKQIKHAAAEALFMRREMQKDDTNFEQSRRACAQGYSPNPANSVLTQEEQCAIVNSEKFEKLREQYQDRRNKKTLDILCKDDNRLCNDPSHGLPAGTQKNEDPSLSK